MRVLNRIVRTHPRRGITIEPDPRHAEILIRELDGDSGRLVTTPMTKETVSRNQWNPSQMTFTRKQGTGRSKEKTTERTIMTNWNRALVARANYLAVDRGDIAFCFQELARCMSSPSRQDWERLQRLARYLRHKPRCVLWYVYQGTIGEVTCFTDSDWAGCKRTRRSTSGGCMLWGSHRIKMWSRTQAIVSLSSAEAELYAAIKACSETLKFLTLLKDYQIYANGKVMSDASAALGIIERRGYSKSTSEVPTSAKFQVQKIVQTCSPSLWHEKAQNTCQNWLGWNFPRDTTKLPSPLTWWVSQDVIYHLRYNHHCRILGWVARTSSGQEWISGPNVSGHRQKVVHHGRTLRQGWLWMLQLDTWSRLRQRETSHETVNTGCYLKGHVTLSRCWSGEIQRLWVVCVGGYCGRASMKSCPRAGTDSRNLALRSWRFVRTQRRRNPLTMWHGQMKRRRCQPMVAAWRVCEPQCVHAWLFLPSLWQLWKFEVEKGFHMNSSWTIRVLCLSELRKLECFKHALVVSDVTLSVAHLRLCASAPSLFASVSVVLGCSVSPCRSQWDFDGHVVLVPTTVLNESHSFLVLSQDWLVVYICFGSRYRAAEKNVLQFLK